MIAVDDFLKSLVECQLLDSVQLSEVERDPLARHEDPGLLAQELVRRGWLTRYQAGHLLRNRPQGLVLGPYRLLERLGKGSMGQVFKAFHSGLGRVVAVKVLRKERLVNPHSVRRFHQEIRAVGRLAHPNIVAGVESGQVEDVHFLAMEYVQGTDLARLVKDRGPLPVAEACDYIRQAALGLQHAHERGLVHRDIKPSNLVLSLRIADCGLRIPDSAGVQSSQTAIRNPQSAIVKILDLGLARLIEPFEGPALTRPGAMLGTPEYLAPEQATDSRVDIRADLYSLGCAFYYLLTGQPPFRSSSLTDLLLRHRTAAPAPLAGFRPDVPPGVQAVVRKLLAKRPEDRFQTPAELAAALAPDALANDPSPARFPVWTTVSAQSCGIVLEPTAARRNFFFALLCVAGAAALAGLVLLGILRSHLNPFGRTNTPPPGAVPSAAAPASPTHPAEPGPAPELLPQPRPDPEPVKK